MAVFLHGFASSQSGEKAVYLRDRLLDEGFSYVTFDFRGHGESEGSMRDLTIEGLLEDCAQVIEPLAEQYSRVALIGSSMGACAAAWYCALNPVRVAACAFIAPAFDFVRTLTRAVKPEQIIRWKRDRIVQFMNEHCAVELDYRMVEESEKYTLAELTKSYRTPALIVHGVNDESVSYRESIEFIERSGAERARLILVRDGDHRLTSHKEELGDWIGLHLKNYC